MTGNPRSSRYGLPLVLLFITCLPLTLGQLCQGLNPVVPTPPAKEVSATGNTPPSFQFLKPDQDISAQVGDIITITWTDGDPDNNAAITLLADPDNVFGNGNELVVLPLVMEDDPANTFSLDTSSLPPASYRIIARVNDNLNPELIAVAPGRLLLYGAGYLPGNISPTITMTQPDTNIALAQGDTSQLSYCGHDPDGGLNGTVDDVIIMLDTDEDPTNDLDLTGPNRESNLLAACASGSFPQPINGVLVLGCAKDDNCTALNNATNFPLTVDVSQIPPRVSGEPYWPRVTMWDHSNPPVHSYSRGNISITSLGSGTIDLGLVGRTISGAKFYGIDPDGQAGSNGLGVGDLDGDGVDDFVLVSRFGNGYMFGNVGTAHVVMGRKGQKFGSEVSLNSIGSLYRGCMLNMPATTATDGIRSLCRLTDVDGDGHPDFAFGLPYVELFGDNLQDDLHHCPCPADANAAPGCYGDLLPNPFSGTIGQCEDSDAIGARDGHCGPGGCREWFFGLFVCSNDLDPLITTPINGGYTILVSSRNALGTLNSNVYALGDMGQSRSGGAPYGARWRGPWYDVFDFTQTVRPYAIIPDNRFGETVNSMPDMNDTSLSAPASYGPELLISSPLGYGGRGSILYNARADWTRLNAAASYPWYVPLGACPPQQIGRALVVPHGQIIIGAAVGDHLGYAASAGDFNLDGSNDILMGAPGAERNGVPQCGIVYVLFGRPDFTSSTQTGHLGEMMLESTHPPRVEIFGLNAGDQFGQMQAVVGDMNQDGIPDIGFASQYADGPGGVDSGFIGVVFGGRRLTGENVFSINDVGTVQLPGFKIYGRQPGGHAGAVLGNAGDFNGDGIDDMVISAPDEIRMIDGQNRRGVAYVIFGGPHLYNGTFSLSQVGTAQLPGVVLISPYAAGSADEAPIDWIASAGDVDGDGFTDVIVGVSEANFIDPLAPNQRRPHAGEAYLIYGNNTGTNRLGR